MVLSTDTEGLGKLHRMGNQVLIALEKLKSIRNAVMLMLDADGGPGASAKPPTEYAPSQVSHYFTSSVKQVEILKAERPEWFGDFHVWSQWGDVITRGSERSTFDLKNWRFSRRALQGLISDVGRALDLAAAMHMADETSANKATSTTPTLVPMSNPSAPLNKVFITHGRSKDWMEVQSYIEKDLKLGTLELAQEASGGKTIIEKLEAYAPKCDGAVIVMSGDDLDAAGQARVRENVMHEIGFFHGKFGRDRVVLLHQNDVSVPTNLAGIVYVPYPKDTVSATFGVLARELKAMYGLP